MLQEPQEAEGRVSHRLLVETLQKVVPFTLEEKDATTREHLEHLKHVWLEVDGGRMEFSSCDGVQLAHATMEADWPNGQWLVQGKASRILIVGSITDEDLPVRLAPARIVVAKTELPVVDTKWLDYRKFYQEATAGVQAMIVLGRKQLRDALKDTAATMVGVKLTRGHCLAYLARDDRKTMETVTLAKVPLSVQMASGESQACFDMGRLKKLARCCGEALTIKLTGEGKATLFEGEGCWYLLMPTQRFPGEFCLTPLQRQSLEWAEDLLQSIKKGEVQAQVQLGGGKLVVRWEPPPEQTTVEVPVESP